MIQFKELDRKSVMPVTLHFFFLFCLELLSYHSPWHWLTPGFLYSVSVDSGHGSHQKKQGGGKAGEQITPSSPTTFLLWCSRSRCHLSSLLQVLVMISNVDSSSSFQPSNGFQLFLIFVCFNIPCWFPLKSPFAKNSSKF